jgi:hypothetical protein
MVSPKDNQMRSTIKSAKVFGEGGEAALFYVRIIMLQKMPFLHRAT